MEASVEKRRFVRAPVQLKVDCEYAEGDQGESQQCFSTMNVSVGGVFLETEKSFEPGMKLDMSVKLTRPELAVNMSGTVMWFAKSSGEALNGVGVEFEFASERDKKLLEGFVVNELVSRL